MGKRMDENISTVYREPADALLRQQPGAGSPLFIINLCTSMAPMEITGKTLAGFESYRIYTVARVEDGRTRYRLRMGFFVSQQTAEEVAGALRKQYAMAFSACLSEEDRRFTRGYVPAASAHPRPAVAVMPQPAPQAHAAPTKATASVPVTRGAAAPVNGSRNAQAARNGATGSFKVAPGAFKPEATGAFNAGASGAFKAGASGEFKLDATGSFKPNASGSFKPDRTGSFKAGASGTFKALAPASKLDATGSHKTGATGSYKVLPAAAAKLDSTGSFKAGAVANAGATGSYKALPAAAAAKAEATGSFKNGSTGSFKAFASGAAKLDSTGTFKGPAANFLKADATGSFKAGAFKPEATGAFKAGTKGTFKPEATGAFKAGVNGAFKPDATGSFKPDATGRLKAATGSHKALDRDVINEIEISWERADQKGPQPSAASAPANQVAKPNSSATAKPAAPKVSPNAPVAAKAQPGVKAPAARAPEPEVKNPPVTLKSSAPVRLELEAAPAAAKASAPQPASGNQPFHVGKGVNIPNVSLSLQSEMAKAAAKSGESSTRLPKLTPADAPANKAVAKTPASAQLPPRLAGLPELDSTQTIRALTNEEMSDASQEKWWSIQLAVSEQAVNLDAMPHLDIFEAYRLYSVASAGSGKIVHSLRLGFFREAVSAEAVTGYLKTFFASPSVLRISTAEHARFKDAPQSKAHMAKNESKVIDLNDARDRVKPVPVVTMEVADIDRSPTGAFKAASVAAKSSATGMHKALSPAIAKPAAPAARQPLPTPANKMPPRRGTNKAAATRKGRGPSSSLQDQLLEAAREVELSESGVRRLPKNDSLLSRLVDKLKK